MPDREAAVREALTAACAISDEHARAESLAALAPHLPNALLYQAVAAARAISDEAARAQSLVALAAKRKSDWTSLEIAKLLVPIVASIVLAYIGFAISKDLAYIGLTISKDIEAFKSAAEQYSKAVDALKLLSMGNLSSQRRILAPPPEWFKQLIFKLIIHRYE
jgi:hypothetical protein